MGERVHQHRRQRRDQRAGHHLAPVEDVLAEHLGQAYRDGPSRDRIGDHQRVQELVPGLGEREQAHHHQGGRGQRQHDSPEHAQSVAAVDQGRFLELDRDALEVAHQQPGAEGQRQRRVHQDQCTHRVGQADPGDHLEKGNEEQRLRHQVREDEPQGDDAAAGEAQPRDGVCAQCAERDRQCRGRDRHLGAVAQPDAELTAQQRHVVPEVHRFGQQREVVVDLFVGLDRRKDHPDERDDRPQHEHDERDVGGDHPTAADGSPPGAS